MCDNVVLIPYRNRKTHLDYFINNTVPLFEKWLPNTKVVVVEQTASKLFNRSALLNVGFKEYQNKTKYFKRLKRWNYSTLLVYWTSRTRYYKQK